MNKSENNLHLLPGLYLLQFEAICHDNLIKCLNELLTTELEKPKYGCVNGLNTFISFGHFLDESIFLYESLKHFSILSLDDKKAFTELPRYSDLKVVRNNIHTYFKKGSFDKKASRIIEEKLKEYKLDKPDLLYLLRNDISLVFQIKNNARFLIGSDYFIYHCIDESVNKTWTGLDYKEYAAFISSSIKGIASSIDKTQYCLSDLILLEKMPSIELFDFKSSDLFVSSAVSQVSTFRLLLMLYQISYALILVEEIFDINRINEDDLWSCFFIKLVAIKYDESFDNLQKQSSNPILSKIYNNEKISQQDLQELEKVVFKDLGSKEDYQKYYGAKPITILIREINGLEKEAVEKAFAEFMHKYNLNRNQTEFLRVLMQF